MYINFVERTNISRSCVSIGIVYLFVKDNVYLSPEIKAVYPGILVGSGSERDQAGSGTGFFKRDEPDLIRVSGRERAGSG